MVIGQDQQARDWWHRGADGVSNQIEQSAGLGPVWRQYIGLCGFRVTGRAAFAGTFRP
jgi:hypothetical protein